MEQSNEYSQDNIQGEYQYSQSYQTTPGIDHHYNADYSDANIESWPQLLGETSGLDNPYRDISQSDTSTDQTTSFGFQQQEGLYQYNQNLSTEEINSEMDYETIIRSKHLYYDPDPKIIRKNSTIEPLIYNQNIKIRFLQPPPVPQGPLIIREVRPSQPPPPPPLIIRQRAPPPPSPPPLILREQPPPVPPPMGEQVVTKVLPIIPPPPRSVIVERLPPLPPKPRDVIIERWIPYESMQKRKVIVHRAEEAKQYPPPRNIVITYDPIPIRVIRQVERLNVKPEDPRSYSSVYGNSLLSTEQLLAQIRDLGIMDDLSPPHGFNTEQQTSASSSFSEQNFDYNVSPQQQIYSDNYAPTYENLVSGSTSSVNYEESNEQPIVQDSSFNSSREDLSSQLAQYGLTADSIPY